MEIKTLEFIQTLRTSFLDRLFCFVTKLGDKGFIWIFLGVSLLLFRKKRYSGAVLLTALILEFIICNKIMKNAFMRIRPCDIYQNITLLIENPGGYSFPSGHTASSFAAVTALFITDQKKLFKPALILAVLIAFSRIYLFVHYPTDIMGGIISGIFCGYIGKKLTDKLHRLFTEN